MNKEAKKRKRNKLRNKRLLKRYPFLAPVDWWFKKIPTRIHRYDFTMYDDIPKGWRLAFGEELLEDIRSAMIEDGVALNRLWFSQIKEKYGALRMYAEGNLPSETYKKINRIIDDYSRISEYCCIRCGKPDVGSTSGWIIPICEKCWNTNINRTGNYKEEINQNDTTIPDFYQLHKFYNGRKDEVVKYNIKDKADKIRNRYKHKLKMED